jgi:hypothetical protein
MAHGERASYLEKHLGKEYWGRLHYLQGQDRDSKRISHRLERAFQKRVLLQEKKEAER